MHKKMRIPRIDKWREKLPGYKKKRIYYFNVCCSRIYDSIRVYDIFRQFIINLL